MKPVWNRLFLIFPTSFSTSFVLSFLKELISLNFWTTTMFKTPMESLFWVLSHGYNFTAVNRRFWRWNRSEIADFLQVLFEFYKELYFPQFLSYNNVKDSFWKLILSTFIWLQFRRFWRWNRSEIVDFCIFYLLKQGFWILISPLILEIQKS